MTARDRRLPLIGGSLCVAILLLGHGIPRARDWYEDERANAHDLELRLANARRSVSTASVAQGELVARQRQLDSVSRTVFVGRSSSASASAAAHISRLARNARVEVSSIQIAHDSSKAGAVKRIGVIASARADIRGLANWLVAVESGAKRFRVMSLSVSQSDVVGQPGAPEILNVQLTLRAITLEQAR